MDTSSQQRKQLLQLVDVVWPGGDAVALLKRAAATILLYQPENKAKIHSLTAQLAKSSISRKKLGVEDTSFKTLLGSDPLFSCSRRHHHVTLDVDQLKQMAASLLQCQIAPQLPPPSAPAAAAAAAETAATAQQAGLGLPQQQQEAEQQHKTISAHQHAQQQTAQQQQQLPSSAAAAAASAFLDDRTRALQLVDIVWPGGDAVALLKRAAATILLYQPENRAKLASLTTLLAQRSISRRTLGLKNAGSFKVLLQSDALFTVSNSKRVTLDVAQLKQAALQGQVGPQLPLAAAAQQTVQATALGLHQQPQQQQEGEHQQQKQQQQQQKQQKQQQKQQQQQQKQDPHTAQQQAQLLQLVDTVWPGTDAVSLLKRAAAAILLYQQQHRTTLGILSSTLGERSLSMKKLGIKGSFKKLLNADPVFVCSDTKKTQRVVLDVHQLQQAAAATAAAALPCTTGQQRASAAVAAAAAAAQPTGLGLPPPLLQQQQHGIQQQQQQHNIMRKRALQVEAAAGREQLQLELELELEQLYMEQSDVDGMQQLPPPPAHQQPQQQQAVQQQMLWGTLQQQQQGTYFNHLQGQQLALPRPLLLQQQQHLGPAQQQAPAGHYGRPMIMPKPWLVTRPQGVPHGAPAGVQLLSQQQLYQQHLQQQQQQQRLNDARQQQHQPGAILQLQDSSSRRPRKKHKGKQPAAGTQTLAPISWVPGGVIDPAAPAVATAAAAAVDTTAQEAAAAAAAAAVAARVAVEAADAAAAAAAQAETAGKWGVAHKLMAKMGYKPGQGLGRDGRGIKQPIQPRCIIQKRSRK